MHFQREPEMEFLLFTLRFCNYQLPSSMQVFEEVFLLCSLISHGMAFTLPKFLIFSLSLHLSSFHLSYFLS
jgi:hypothetical protein